MVFIHLFVDCCEMLRARGVTWTAGLVTKGAELVRRTARLVTKGAELVRKTARLVTKGA